MAGGHERFEGLAVGHVFGGLGPEDAATFRAHLLACSECRSTVSELRGIAADLEAAEREEKARGRVRTRPPRRVREGPGEDAEPDRPRSAVRAVAAAALAVFVLAVGVSFWNLHLRTTSSTYAAVAELRGDALRELATGVAVDTELDAGISGLVVVDGGQVGFSLVGIGALAADESLVGWLLHADGTASPALLVRPGQLDDGALAAVVEDGGEAEVFVLSRERGQPGAAPSDRVVVLARLGVPSR